MTVCSANTENFGDTSTLPEQGSMDDMPYVDLTTQDLLSLFDEVNAQPVAPVVQQDENLEHTPMDNTQFLDSLE